MREIAGRKSFFQAKLCQFVIKRVEFCFSVVRRSELGQAILNLLLMCWAIIVIVYDGIT